jgi:hypothetical protein
LNGETGLRLDGGLFVRRGAVSRHRVEVAPAQDAQDACRLVVPLIEVLAIELGMRGITCCITSRIAPRMLAAAVVGTKSGQTALAVMGRAGSAAAARR